MKPRSVHLAKHDNTTRVRPHVDDVSFAHWEAFVFGRATGCGDVERAHLVATQHFDDLQRSRRVGASGGGNRLQNVASRGHVVLPWSADSAEYPNPVCLLRGDGDVVSVLQNNIAGDAGAHVAQGGTKQYPPCTLERNLDALLSV